MKSVPSTVAFQRIGLASVLCMSMSCAPATRSLVVKDGRALVVDGPLRPETSPIAVVLWTGSAGDDPEIVSIDGVEIVSASTNNRMELAPGKHTVVFRAAWHPGDRQDGDSSSRWAHEKVAATEDVNLLAGHCYYPRQLKTKYIVGEVLVPSSPIGSQATEPAHLEDYAIDSLHGPNKQFCAR